jgi:hypothetical protein
MQALYQGIRDMGLCARVGIWRAVLYVFCGLEKAHAGACSYAPNPSSELTVDREPLALEDVEPVDLDGPQIPPLRELLTERARTRPRVPLG